MIVTKKKLPTVGKKVRFRRRNGDVVTGKVLSQISQDNGIWLDVEIAKGSASYRVRPSQCEVL